MTEKFAKKLALGELKGEYGDVFDILMQQKITSSATYTNNKHLIEITLAMLDPALNNVNERFERAVDVVGSKETFTLNAVRVQNEIHVLRCLGFVLKKQNLSNDLKNNLIEMCAGVFQVSSLFGFANQYAQNQFWESVESRIEHCLCNIYLD